MSIFGGKKEQLSLRLVTHIENSIEEFCIAMKLSDDGISISDLLDYNALTRLSRNFNLRVKIAEIKKPSSKKEPPIGIDLLLGREPVNGKEEEAPAPVPFIVI